MTEPVTYLICKIVNSVQSRMDHEHQVSQGLVLQLTHGKHTLIQPCARSSAEGFLQRHREVEMHQQEELASHRAVCVCVCSLKVPVRTYLLEQGNHIEREEAQAGRGDKARLLHTEPARAIGTQRVNRSIHQSIAGIAQTGCDRAVNR